MPAPGHVKAHSFSMHAAKSGRLLPVLCLGFGLGGCSTGGAPSFPLVGAYFPAWMLCGLIGIATAVGLRVLFLAIGLDALMSFRLFTYVSLGVITALLVWALVFGP
ncbi:YtcA family lipoprotein [Gluconobacter morbifer]|nr:YtcA family lipoprotein [Gluconobacter morbifer]